MPTPLRLQLPTDDPDNILAPYLQSYRGHFSARRYGPKHLRRYVAIVIHFGRWLQAEGLRADQLDGTIVSRFLVDHLPRCTCQRPVQRDVIGNRAALNHLVQLLRALAVAAVRADDEITRELASFAANAFGFE